MAKKKKSFFGTLLKIGGLAAATAAIYSKRNEIKAFVADAAERIFPDNPEVEPVEEIMDEPEIVIDTKNSAEQPDETKQKEAEEDAPEE